MVMTIREPDFTQVVEADFIVALKTKAGGYTLFFESFFRKNGKSYLKHTAKLADAKRLSKFAAFDVCAKLADFSCIGRVERVSPDNSAREIIEQ